MGQKGKVSPWNFLFSGEGGFSNVERGFQNEATTNNDKALLYITSGCISLSMASDASLLWFKKEGN